MAKQQTASTFQSAGKRKRPGVHAKSKNSVHKTGKHYSKVYRGQGR